MGTNTRFNWFNLVFKKMKEIWKYPSFLWAGRKKGKRFFYRLCFCAAVRMSRKTGTEDFTSGPAKRVRLWRIVVEGLYDFRRKGKNIVGKYLVYKSGFNFNCMKFS